MIDAHHHLWNYDAADYPWIPVGSPLHASFGPAELAAVTQPCGVTATVVVQARQTLDETDWLLSLADSHELVAAVVGWVPLAAGDVGETLDHLADRPRLRGIRHVVQDEPEGFLDGDAFNAGLREVTRTGLVYDLLIYGRQLEETIRFVDRHPEQRFVLDHIAKPTIRPGQFDTDWERDFRELARRERVSCKFSGVATEVRSGDEGATWSVETVRPYWEVALEAFGPERLMYGSDWPVALLATEYARWNAVVRELSGSLSQSEREAVFRGTATRAYGLDTID